MFCGYTFIRKQNLTSPDNLRVLAELPSDLHKFEGQPVAFDFETTGLDPQVDHIRSIAIANDYGAYAIDLDALSANDRRRFSAWLIKQKLIAHNASFDASWIYTKMGTMPTIEACTLLLFKLLATEGYLGQSWGLKTAMTDILGWEESNEEDLYKWLKDNKLAKKDMSKAPWTILGKYNALDAAATWQLYKYFRDLISINGWDDTVYKFHQEDFLNLIQLTIEQQISGMSIDLDALAEYDDELETRISEKRQEFLTHVDVKPHIDYYQQILIEELTNKKPEQFTKSGSVAARYLKWQEKLATLHSQSNFNIDSVQQLQWLFYDRLMMECPIKTDKGLTSVGKKALPHLGEPGKVLKEYRELRDRRKFVTALFNVQQKGVVHPRVKGHGTVTGRSSGGIEE